MLGGSNAVELVLRAHEKVADLRVLIERKQRHLVFYKNFCFLRVGIISAILKARDQSCSDFTGSFGEYERTGKLTELALTIRWHIATICAPAGTGKSI